MSKAVIIAGKEWKDIYRSRVFTLMTALLILLTLLSVTVSFAVFDSQLAEYHKSLDILRDLGKLQSVTPPELHPLNLLRGVVDYVEIIGAVLGIILGYVSIAKEKTTKTARLILTRPVTRAETLHGKILGNTLFVFVLMLFTASAVTAAIYITEGSMPDAVQMAKIGLFTIFSTVYVMIFFMIAVFFSLRMKNTGNALILSFIMWLVFVLLLPQIGDTMDPDNQVPGGFFKSMQIDRGKEKQIMAQFSTYETVRGGMEQLSVTKHFERVSFALFGIKSMYNGMPLPEILLKNKPNIIFLFGAFALTYIACLILLIRSRNYLGG